MNRSARNVATAILVGLLCTALSGPAWSTPRCEGKLTRVRIEAQQEETLSLLRARKFAALQQRMDDLLAAYVAGRLSDEELFYEFGAFDRWGPFLTPLIREWVAAFPLSFSAHQAMALHLASVAWQTRGSGFASETSNQQLDEFHRQLADAQGWAVRATKLHTKPIVAYQLLVATSKASRVDLGLWARLKGLRDWSAPRSALDAPQAVKPLIDEALRIQPDNVIVRHAYIELLAPRWGGSIEALQAYSSASAHPGLSPDRVASVAYMARMEIAADHRLRKAMDRAVEGYEAAAKLCRLNQPLIDIAAIRLDQARYAEALDAADRAIALVPDSPNGLRFRARALQGLQRHTEAFALLQALAPQGSPEVLYLLGEYHLSGEGGAKRDVPEARRLISLAATRGNERAIKRLAAIDAMK